MICRYHFSVMGPKNALDEFDAAAGVTRSTVKHVKRTDLPESLCWRWKSPELKCLTSFPEDEVLHFMQQQTRLLEMASTPPYDELTRTMSIVAEYSDAHPPHGFSISLELLELLTAYRTVLDIDVVRRLNP